MLNFHADYVYKNFRWKKCYPISKLEIEHKHVIVSVRPSETPEQGTETRIGKKVQNCSKKSLYMYLFTDLNVQFSYRLSIKEYLKF